MCKCERRSSVKLTPQGKGAVLSCGGDYVPAADVAADLSIADVEVGK